MNIFITGGTTGIGLELAIQYLDLGSTVGICGRDISKLPEKIKERYSKKQILSFIPYYWLILNQKILRLEVY